MASFDSLAPPRRPSERRSHRPSHGRHPKIRRGIRRCCLSVDFEVGAGELVAVVGPSGGGKTTLLSIIGALDTGFEGRAELLGRNLAELSDDQRALLRNESIGFVFQAFHLLEHLSVVENVELALWLLPRPVPVDETRSRAVAALAEVGLGGREDEPVSRLSGGERQRVAVARAVVNQPRLLLADEPTGNLDDPNSEVIVDIFEQVRRRASCAVVMATHDNAVAERADRIVRLSGGRLTTGENECD